MSKFTPRGAFPSQSVPDVEKSSESYGLEVSKAIESEWFKRIEQVKKNNPKPEGDPPPEYEPED